MDTLKTEAKDIERVLSELKVQLYAKFGSSINLESDWGRVGTISLLVGFTTYNIIIVTKEYILVVKKLTTSPVAELVSRGQRHGV